MLQPTMPAAAAARRPGGRSRSLPRAAVNASLSGRGVGDARGTRSSGCLAPFTTSFGVGRHAPSAAMRPRPRALRRHQRPRSSRARAGLRGTADVVGHDLPPGGRVTATRGRGWRCIVARRCAPCVSESLVPMGYRRAGVRPVPLLDGPSPQTGAIRHGGPRPQRWPSHTSQPARSRRPHPPRIVRRVPTPCAGSPPRSAAAMTSTACSTTSSTRPSPCSASTRPACGCTTRPPTAAQRGRRSAASRRRSSSSSTRCRATPRRSAWTRIREQQVQVLGGDLSAHRCPAAGDLSTGRHPDHLLRPARVPRRAARAARPLPPQRRTTGRPTRLDLARAFADHMATAIANARLVNSTADDGRRACGRSQELRQPAQPDPGRQGIGEAIVAEAVADRPRHDPRLPRRPRDRDVRADRLPGRRSWGSATPMPDAAPGRGRRRPHGLGRGPRRADPARRRARRTRAACWSASRPTARSRCCSSR